MSYIRPTPIITVHQGIHVVRDDLYPRGPKPASACVSQ
jgi:hypothetical protein